MLTHSRDSVLPPKHEGQHPSLSCSPESLPGPALSRHTPQIAEQTSGKGAPGRTVCRGPRCSWEGVRVHRQQAPVGEAALTAQRDQAQVQRQAFPVTELCAFESREFLCFVCFRDLKTNRLRGNCRRDGSPFTKLNNIKVKIMTLSPK